MRALLRREDGTTALEFAIVGPLIMAGAIFILSLGQVLEVRHQMSFALDKGVRAALLNRTITAAEIEDVVRVSFTQEPAGDLQVTVVDSTSEGAAVRIVRARFPVQLFFLAGVKALTLNVARYVPVA